MKTGFYPKLAWTGIKKNKKIYVPYMLACAGMIMMFYMICFLSTSEIVRGMKGGETMQMTLSFGCLVISVFALIFLFYTNSFLMKRRYKEFGLYHILGMGKKNVAYVMIWECIQITGITLVFGIGCGIFFSKLGELAMIKMLGGKADFHFTISVSDFQNETGGIVKKRTGGGKTTKGELDLSCAWHCYFSRSLCHCPVY